MKQANRFEQLLLGSTRVADEPALIDKYSQVTTYSQLLKNIGQIKQQLEEVGLGDDDVITVAMRNGPAMVQTLIGCMSQCTCAPLMPDFTTDEFKRYLLALGPKIVLADNHSNPAIQQAADELEIPVCTVTETDRRLTLDNISANIPDRSTPDLPEGSALLLFSSGTTALPKLIPLTHQNIIWSTQSISSHLQLTNVDKTICTMPLYHVHGLLGTVFATLASDGQVYCPPHFDEIQFFDILNQTKISWYSAVPTIHKAILEALRLHAERMPGYRLRFIRSSSSALTEDVRTNLESAFNAPVIEAYGMTECSHQLASNFTPPGQRKPGSVGKAVGCKITVLDDKGHEVVDPGTIGELAVTGSNITPGYINIKTSPFGEYGLLTGDLGYKDKDGFIFIIGRLKEIVNRGGEKISPAEIDQYILEHKAVESVACFGISHESLGEILAAAIVKQPDAQLTDTKLREYLQLRLVNHKVPDHFVFIDRIPRTLTGKPQRQLLAQQYSDFPVPSDTICNDEIESKLLAIWKSVLSIESIGLNQNFFVLGGDSLKATRVAAAMQDEFSVEITPTVLFTASTIRGLRNWLNDKFPTMAVKHDSYRNHSLNSNSKQIDDPKRERIQISL